jgi:hypothetical protein
MSLRPASAASRPVLPAAGSLFALVIASIAGAARADDLDRGPLPPGHVAVPVRPADPPRPPAPVAARPKPPPLLLGFHVEGGVFSATGLPLGGYGRLGSMLFFTPRRRGPGPVAGFWGAWEGWRAPGSGGLALPFVGFGGFETPAFFGRVGAGFNVFTVDHREGKTVGGLFSPRAQVRLGFRVKVVEFGVEADVQRRWVWKMDDWNALGAGLFVVVLGEEKLGK